MRNVTRERGDSVDLRCSFTGDGVIKAKWVHQGEEWTLEGDQQEVRSEEYTDKDDGASITTIKVRSFIISSPFARSFFL